MADIIQLLPDHVANQIAAGEVVQRPASVVKELMENAIDAGASLIQVIIKDAGKTLIQVIDDGTGMSMTDARLAFERHATSKIRSADDLFSIHTKGFRGEALASIAAIAHIDLKTRRQEDELGTHIIMAGSQVENQEATVSPVGTSVSVKNLFFNVPARRNFLKSNPVELRHILDEFHRVALAHPKTAFKLHHNDSELFNLPVSNLRQRIVNIFGTKTNEKLVPVNEETEVVKISGFVGKPEFAKKTRGEQFFFVNDRFIKSSYLNHAVNSAFEGLLRDGTHAGYFLYLEVDAGAIDVNIHPTKTEIKFEDEHTIYAILRSAVKHSLGQFQIAPVLDFDRDPSMDTPYSYREKRTDAPRIEVDRDYNPFRKAQGISTGFRKEKSTSWENLYIGLESDNQDLTNHTQFEADPDEQALAFSEKENKIDIKTFQVHNKYIINAIKSGLIVIHQNRAHQRILYETLLKNITVSDGISQKLLFPVKCQFSAPEIEILKSILPQLIQTGFGLSVESEGEIEITALPVSLKPEQVLEVLETLIADIQQDVPDAHFSQSDMIAKSLARGMAVKSGQKLDLHEQVDLVDRLFGCKEPGVSPFNAPTFITLSTDEISKKFS